MAMTFGQVMREAPSIARDLYENHVTRHFKVIAPTVLHVNVNLRCNTTCAMCNIWQLKSPHALGLADFEKIFADPLYRRIEYVILAGGEPTLRGDLAEIVETMHRWMPRLKKLMIPSNLINRASIEKQYARIAHYCDAHKIRLTLGVSLDGIGGTHDQIRGVKGAFDKVIDNISLLKRLQKEVPFNMSIDPTIFSMNLHELKQLAELAERLSLPITFQIAAVAGEYYHNTASDDVMKIDESARVTLVEFLKRRVAESSLLDALAYYYAEVVENLQGAPKRALPCPFADQGVLLNPDGTLQYCHNSRPIGNALQNGSSDLYFAAESLEYRNQVRNEVCPSCRMSCLFFVSLRKEGFSFLSFMAKRLLGVHRLHWRRPKAKAAQPA